MTSNEKLDIVLRYLINREEKGTSLYVIQEELIGENKPLTTYELWAILLKLEKDGYVTELEKTIDIPEANIINNALYVLTFEGYVFIENGGYTEQKKQEIRTSTFQALAIWVTAIGTGLGGLYIVGKFLIWVYYFCHC